MKDVLWGDIFKLGASVAAVEFYEFRLELIYVSLLVNTRPSLTHLQDFQQRLQGIKFETFFYLRKIFLYNFV